MVKYQSTIKQVSSATVIFINEFVGKAELFSMFVNNSDYATRTHFEMVK